MPAASDRAARCPDRALDWEALTGAQLEILWRPSASDYGVLVASDVEASFAEKLLFRTTEPKLMDGTHGLVSAVWHRSKEHYSSMSLPSDVEKQAERVIREAD